MFLILALLYHNFSQSFSTSHGLPPTSGSSFVFNFAHTTLLFHVVIVNPLDYNHSSNHLLQDTIEQELFTFAYPYRGKFYSAYGEKTALYILACNYSQRPVSTTDLRSDIFLSRTLHHKVAIIQEMLLTFLANFRDSPLINVPGTSRLHYVRAFN